MVPEGTRAAADPKTAATTPSKNDADNAAATSAVTEADDPTPGPEASAVGDLLLSTAFMQQAANDGGAYTAAVPVTA